MPPERLLRQKADCRSQTMKDKVFDYVTSAMEKCTSEQHWAVASVTAIDAAFVAAAEKLHFRGCTSVISAILLVVAFACGLCFVWLRHQDYFFWRDTLANMIRDEDYVPLILRRPADRKSIRPRAGVLAYSLWILLTSCFALLVLWKVQA